MNRVTYEDMREKVLERARTFPANCANSYLVWPNGDTNDSSWGTNELPLAVRRTCGCPATVAATYLQDRSVVGGEYDYNPGDVWGQIRNIVFGEDESLSPMVKYLNAAPGTEDREKFIAVMETYLQHIEREWVVE